MLENTADNNSLSRKLWLVHQGIIQNERAKEELAQMKKDIVEELKPFITLAIDIQVKNNATPEFRELDRLLKNLGNL